MCAGSKGSYGADPMKLLGIINHVRHRQTFRMALLTNFTREPVIRRLEARHGLIRPEWLVIACLEYRDGSSARDICEITDQPRNTISRGVLALEKKGLVRRDPDPIDARRTRLWLTDAGRRLHEEWTASGAAIEELIVSLLSPEERMQLDMLLGKLCLSLPSIVAARREMILDEAGSESAYGAPPPYGQMDGHGPIDGRGPRDGATT